MHQDISIKIYSEEDRKELIQLIEELQDYLVKIDPLKRLRRLPNYGDEYVEKLLIKIEKENGIIFIANHEDTTVGLIAGIIEIQDENDLLECVPTKTGRILELIVSENHRGKKIGSMLMKRLEEHFKQHNCNMVRVEVFEPNKSAHNFYAKNDYQERVIDLAKII